jgi:hypothetical protein
MSQTYDVIDYYFPLILFEHCVMMSMLCNCCVRELLILAHTWFAFGLPSKTGCDTFPVLNKVSYCNYFRLFVPPMYYNVCVMGETLLGKVRNTDTRLVK